MNGAEREALRQQMLLRSLLGDEPQSVLASWMRDGPRFDRGHAAYRANAGALAERALAAAYPTLQQLVGEASFAALARDHWRQRPPRDGDVAQWGGELADFVADAESLADEPCLADVARLEWVVHKAQGAADAAPLQGLARLGSEDPDRITLRLVPGTATLVSDHPVATIWHAHRSDAPDRFDAVREAYVAGGAEAVVVARQGWRVTVRKVGEGEWRYTEALLAGASLAQALALALAASGAAFDFQTWLVDAVRQQRIEAVEVPER